MAYVSFSDLIAEKKTGKDLEAYRLAEMKAAFPSAFSQIDPHDKTPKEELYQDQAFFARTTLRRLASKTSLVSQTAVLEGDVPVLRDGKAWKVSARSAFELSEAVSSFFAGSCYDEMFPDRTLIAGGTAVVANRVLAVYGNGVITSQKAGGDSCRIKLDTRVQPLVAFSTGSCYVYLRSTQSIVKLSARTLAELGNIRYADRVVTKNGKRVHLALRALSAKAGYLFTLHSRGILQVWDPKAGTVVKTVKLPMESAVDFSVSGSQLAATDGEGRVHVYEWRREEKIHQIFTGKSAVTQMELSYGLLVTGHQDGTVRVWDLDEAGKLLREFSSKGERGPVHSLRLDADRLQAVMKTGVDSYTLREWDVRGSGAASSSTF